MDESETVPEHYAKLIKKISKCRDFEAKLWTYLESDKRNYLVGFHSRLELTLNEISAELSSIDHEPKYCPGVKDRDYDTLRNLLFDLRAKLLEQHGKLLNIKHFSNEELVALLNGNKIRDDISESSYKIQKIESMLIDLSKKYLAHFKTIDTPHSIISGVGNGLVETIKSANTMSFNDSLVRIIKENYSRHPRVDEYAKILSSGKIKDLGNEWVSMAIKVEGEKIFVARDPVFKGYNDVESRKISDFPLGSLKTYAWNNNLSIFPADLIALLGNTYKGLFLNYPGKWCPVSLKKGDNGYYLMATDYSQHSRGVQ